jgi:hypothetical protein
MTQHEEADRTMPFIREQCPVCGGALTLVTVECQQCHTRLEGPAAALSEPASPVSSSPPAADAARFGALGRLTREQLAFVETFIRARGIIRTVEAMMGISYPTVRNRLDEVIRAMGLSPADEAPSGQALRDQREIATDLAEGRITPEEAHEQLRRLARGDSAS